MRIIDCTDQTGILDDGVPQAPLNATQLAERSLYLARLEGGTYREVTLDRCALCGSDTAYQVAAKERYGIPLATVVCADCGLIRSLSVLDDASLATFYSSQYRRLYTGYDSGSREALAECKRLFDNVRLYSAIRALEPTLTLDASSLVCEVGTWAGANLASFAARGIPTIGCDYDDAYLAIGRARGLNLVHGSMSELREAEVVASHLILSHVLEHVRNPVELLRNGS